MKKLILLELVLLFLATTFSSDNPPGWYQQTLPVNDIINDIFFLDSLNGWVVTQGNYNANDTSYIMQTADGGINWLVQQKNRENLNAVQFLDNNLGYAVGGTNGTTLMTILKTNNGGTNWIALNNLTGVQLVDLFFINKDTGWVCDESVLGGLYKTTDGGLSWQRQLNQSYFIKRIFFINRDTGWVSNNEFDSEFYRTTNGGLNWSLQFGFPQPINDIYFFNETTGIVSSGFSYITTNGGFTWTLTNDGGIRLSFANDTIGWAGSNFNQIMKTTTGGISWYRQYSPIFENSSSAAIDTLEAWAAGTGLVHTTDGGLVGINSTNISTSNKFRLFQNYPNPFNPITKIRLEISKSSDIKLIVYDISGKLISTLINKRLSSGTYEEEVDGRNLPTGVYLYNLFVDGNLIETKKMILIR